MQSRKKPSPVIVPGSWEAIVVRGLEEFDLWVGPHPYFGGALGLYVGPIDGDPEIAALAYSGDSCEDLAERIALAGGSHRAPDFAKRVGEIVAWLTAEEAQIYRVGVPDVATAKGRARRFAIVPA